MSDADADVVEAVRAGDTDAYRELVDRHKRMLYGVIIRLVGDPDVAEELAQETFVKAYARIYEFRREATFATWLVQIGVNAARDHIRRTRRLREKRVVSLDEFRENHGDTTPDRRPASDPGAELEAEEAKTMMRRALAQLPSEYREVLVLKHFENWSYERIAEATGDSIGTLKVRAHRARRLLRERLLRLGWDDAAQTPPGQETRRENPH